MQLTGIRNKVFLDRYALKDKEACPKCDSEDVHRRGYQRNSTTMYARYQCNDCHGWYRGTKSIKLNKKPGTSV